MSAEPIGPDSTCVVLEGDRPNWYECGEPSIGFADPPNWPLCERHFIVAMIAGWGPKKWPVQEGT